VGRGQGFLVKAGWAWQRRRRQRSVDVDHHPRGDIRCGRERAIRRRDADAQGMKDKAGEPVYLEVIPGHITDQ
jgi:hypothetical protein